MSRISGPPSRVPSPSSLDEGGPASAPDEVAASQVSLIDEGAGGDAFDAVPTTGGVARGAGGPGQGESVGGLPAGQAQVLLRLPSPAQSIEAAVGALMGRIDRAAEAMPHSSEVALEASLGESAERIRTAHSEGRVTSSEAYRAIEMLEELTGVLIALEEGRVDVARDAAVEASSDISSFEVTSTTGDMMRISVRPKASEQGQARVKFETVNDDGEEVPKVDRMMVRFDLEGEAGAAVDVQFGTQRDNPELNKAIHGIMFGPDGQPVLNRGGRTVADHHFHQGLEAISGPDSFALFAESMVSRLVGSTEGQ